MTGFGIFITAEPMCDWREVVVWTARLKTWLMVSRCALQGGYPLAVDVTGIYSIVWVHESCSSTTPEFTGILVPSAIVAFELCQG